MNIFNNIIKDEEIIGIGSLVWHQQGDRPTLVHYSFQVFTRQSAITIPSETFEAYGEIHSADKEILKLFHTEYWLVRRKIAALLGEKMEGNNLISEMQQHCEKLSDHYLQLFEQLQPVIKRSKSKEVITSNMEGLSTHILSLKSIACA
jgi:hypothetical protein